MACETVLVVDDEPAFLLGVRGVFEKAGVAVDTAETKDTALKLIQETDYCLLISDLRLSGSSGEEGLEVIRSFKERFPRASAVLLTAYGGSYIRARACEAGADLYFEKPVSVCSLKGLLESCRTRPITPPELNAVK